MSHPILTAKPGEKVFLLGNEAIVRGAIEAGVQVVTCYPGTPSSEVPDTFYRLERDQDTYWFEYSPNEKVALEVGGGASIAGAATLVTMKHVGVNVAADPLMTLAYVGTPGGLVLLSADDPGCHSSQNEQDNRYYARLAGMPVFEPASAQEAKEMTRAALILSRKWEQPVMLRTTTRLNHLRGPVEFREPESHSEKPFTKNPMRFVPIPVVARMRHGELIKNLAAISEEMAETPFNTVSGQGGTAVLSSGISRAYVADSLDELGLAGKVKFIQLGFTHPVNETFLMKALEGVSRLVVVEEGEPILENAVRVLLQKKGIEMEVMGKEMAELSPMGEFSTANVKKALAKATGAEFAEASLCPAEEGLPMRPPNLCAGCPHRATYFAVREAFGDDAFYSTDIGCYTLGILPPLRAADFLLCMGSSISAGSGFAKAGGKPVVAFIGDSTFFHSGITGLVNAVYNRHNLLLVIMDNHTTAMTGHQPHPGVEVTIAGDNESRVDIEAIVRGCGVTRVTTVSPLNLKKMVETVKEFGQAEGVRVIIAREPCPLHARRLLGKKFSMTVRVAEQSDSVKECLEKLACPAFTMENGEVAVNEAMCVGCMVCVQVSPDIKASKRGGK